MEHLAVVELTPSGGARPTLASLADGTGSLIAVVGDVPQGDMDSIVGAAAPVRRAHRRCDLPGHLGAAARRGHVGRVAGSAGSAWCGSPKGEEPAPDVERRDPQPARPRRGARC